MFEQVLSILLDLKHFMAAAALTALLLAGFYILALRSFRWEKKRVRVFGAFFALGRRGRLALSLLYLRWMFVLVCLIEMTDIKALHFLFLGALGLLAGLAVSGVFGCLREFINSALLAAGLIVGNLLVSYMREIQFEWSILAVYGLLGLFILLYCLYFFIRDMRSISLGRRETDVEI